MTDLWHIASFNVRGLSIEKQQVIERWLASGTHHLICISETWLQRQNQYSSNPFYVTQSNPTLSNHYQRSHGGLLLLSHPSLHPIITTLHTTSYLIVVQVGCYRLAFAYLPPSLPDSAVLAELEGISHFKLDYLLGDFNVRLGRLSGDSTTTHSSRKSLLFNWVNRHSLSYFRNINDACSHNDHCFSVTDPHWHYRWLGDSVNTDHGLMSFSVKASESLPPPVPTLQYSFRPLQDRLYQRMFWNVYENTHGLSTFSACHQAYSSACQSMILPSAETTLELIDSTYSVFTNGIKSTMEKMLPNYDARRVKLTPDPLLQNSNLPPSSTTATVLAFKRSQRQRVVKLQSSSPNKTPLEECVDHYTAAFSSSDTPVNLSRSNDVVFGLLLQEEAVKKSFLSYSNTKSMGPDGIHTLVFKCLLQSPSFVSSVTTLFQLFLTTGITPTAWTKCRLHPLVKDPSYPIATKTRPLSLSPIIRRIFERCLMWTWTQAPAPWMELHPSQAGFRRGFSTISHILLSDELSRHENPLSIFLDIKAAFDNVVWSKLVSLLESLDCPPSHLCLIKSLICRPASLELSVNDSERVTLTTMKGVFQGGVISPFIFAVYINPLAIALNASTPIYRPLALLFADDIQLKPKSVAQGQALLDICSSYSTEFGLTWGIPKCGVVKGSSLPASPELYLSSQLLPIVPEYKYLGVVHLADGVDWTSTITRSTAKQKAMLTALSFKPWHLKMRLIIYRTFIRPISEYVAAAATIWSSRAPTVRSSIPALFKEVHCLGHQFIFNVNRFSPVLELISGFGPPEYRLEVLKASLANHVRSLSPTNPLKSAITQYLLSADNNSILSFLSSSPYLHEFNVIKARLLKEALAAGSRRPKKLSYPSFLVSKLKSLYAASRSSNRLCSYYTFDQASPLLLQPAALISKAIKWRMNTLPFKSNCLCGSAFRRTHIACYLQDHPIYLACTALSCYQSTVSRLPDSTYSVLDHLLNIKKYEDFDALLSLMYLGLNA